MGLWTYRLKRCVHKVGGIGFHNMLDKKQEKKLENMTVFLQLNKKTLSLGISDWKNINLSS